MFTLFCKKEKAIDNIFLTGSCTLIEHRCDAPFKDSTVI